MKITRVRESSAVTMVRGGFCWAKITKMKRGKYAVAFGWKDDPVAMPGRTITVGRYGTALAHAEGWIGDYG